MGRRSEHVLVEINSWEDAPEGLGLVAILHHASQLTLEVDDTVGIGDIFANEVDDTLGMGFAWVFALEDGVVVFGDHVGGIRFGGHEAGYFRRGMLRAGRRDVGCMSCNSQGRTREKCC